MNGLLACLNNRTCMSQVYRARSPSPRQRRYSIPCMACRVYLAFLLRAWKFNQGARVRDLLGVRGG
jgi:hypothetical protein